MDVYPLQLLHSKSVSKFEHLTYFLKNGKGIRVEISIADPNPDPLKPYVFWPPGSGSRTGSQRYGSGSFYHEAKIVSKTLIPTVL